MGMPLYDSRTDQCYGYCDWTPLWSPNFMNGDNKGHLVVDPMNKDQYMSAVDSDSDDDCDYTICEYSGIYEPFITSEPTTGGQATISNLVGLDSTTTITATFTKVAIYPKFSKNELITITGSNFGDNLSNLQVALTPTRMACTPVEILIPHQAFTCKLTNDIISKFLPSYIKVESQSYTSFSTRVFDQETNKMYMYTNQESKYSRVTSNAERLLTYGNSGYESYIVSSTHLSFIQKIMPDAGKNGWNVFLGLVSANGDRRFQVLEGPSKGSSVTPYAKGWPTNERWGIETRFIMDLVAGIVDTNQKGHHGESSASGLIAFGGDRPRFSSSGTVMVPTTGGSATYSVLNPGFLFNSFAAFINGSPAQANRTSQGGFTLTIPAGFNGPYPISSSFGGVSSPSNTNFIQYLPPTITTITANIPTEGDVIQIEGANFFNDVNVLSITIGQVSCTDVTFLLPHTKVSCQVAQGSGKDLASILKVGKQSASFSISYNKPTIDTIQHTYNNINQLTLTGSSFSSDLSQITIKVGTYNCTKITFQTPHQSLFCSLPESLPSGNYSVIITVNNQSSSPSSFTYNAAPIINTASPSFPFGQLGNVTISGMSFIQTNLTVSIGNQICDKIFLLSSSELICTYNGLSPYTEEGLPVNITTGLYSTTASVYFYPMLNVACPLNCSSNGECDREWGACSCYKGWDGFACNIKTNGEAPILPEPGVGGETIVGGIDGRNFTISIPFLREVTIDSKVVITRRVKDVTWTSSSKDDVTEKQIFKGSFTDGPGLEIHLLVVSEQRIITFAGEPITLPANSVKYQITVSNWTFVSPLNSLQVIYNTAPPPPSECGDIPSTVENGGNWYMVHTGSSVLKARFANRMIVDGSNVRSSLLQLPTDDPLYAEHQQSNNFRLLSAIVVRSFINSCTLDPNFSVLINTNINSSQEFGCTSSSKPRNKFRVPIIIVASIAAAIAIIVGSILYYKKKRVESLYKEKLKHACMTMANLKTSTTYETFAANGHLYESYVTNKSSYSKSKSYCEASTLQGRRGYLVTVTSEDEWKFLKSTGLIVKKTWLSGNDKVGAGLFLYDSGPEMGMPLYDTRSDQCYGFCDWTALKSPSFMDSDKHYLIVDLVSTQTFMKSDDSDEDADVTICEYSALEEPYISSAPSTGGQATISNLVGLDSTTTISATFTKVGSPSTTFTTTLSKIPSSSNYTITLPSGTGSYNVVISDTNSRTASLTTTYTYQSPYIAAIYPKFSKNELITITGSNFGDNLSNLQVALTPTRVACTPVEILIPHQAFTCKLTNDIISKFLPSYIKVESQSYTSFSTRVFDQETNKMYMFTNEEAKYPKVAANSNKLLTYGNAGYESYIVSATHLSFIQKIMPDAGSKGWNVFIGLVSANGDRRFQVLEGPSKGSPVTPYSTSLPTIETWKPDTRFRMDLSDGKVDLYHENERSGFTAFGGYQPTFTSTGTVMVPTTGGSASYSVLNSGFMFNSFAAFINGSPAQANRTSQGGFTLTIPAGYNGPYPVSSSFGGVSSPSNTNFIQYLPPTITTIVANIPTEGDVIQIEGANFFNDVNVLSITIGQVSCTDVTFLVAHTKVSCRVAQGSGKDLASILKLICTYNGLSPYTEEGLSVNITTGPYSTAASVYFYPMLNIECPLNCSSNGDCDREWGACSCYKGWDGFACNIKSDGNAPSLPEPGVGGDTIVKGADGRNFSISIPFLREVTIDSKIVVTRRVKDVIWTSSSKDDVSGKLIFKGSFSDGPGLEIQLLVVSEQRNITFAGEPLHLPANSVKYQITVSNWTFASPLNSLQVIYDTATPPPSECGGVPSTVENGGNWYMVDSGASVLKARFASRMIVDGSNVRSSLVQLPAEDPLYTERKSSHFRLLSAIVVRSFINSCTLDPNFSVLIKTDAQGKETGCQVAATPNKWKIPIIIAVAIAAAIAIIAATTILIQKKKKESIYKKKMNRLTKGPITLAKLETEA
eukprot:gene64-87_t